MNHIEFTERVRKCVEAMGKRPSALLFIDGDSEWDWTCDMSTVCEIQVFHASEINCHTWGLNDVDCPVIPIGKADGEITWRDRKRFAAAWEL